MRRRVELYINGQQADLDEQSFILFNYTKENIDTPSVVRNSYSKQVTLKGTARNNRIFEGMYRPDRVTNTGQMSVLERIPFMIVADKGVALEKGYCKIDSIKTEGAVHSYTITLYGNLGAFFYKLTTNADGDALTLADLTYGNAGNYNGNTQVGLTASALNTLWNELADALEQGSLDALGSVVSFNPCYNGIADNFDNKKLMVKAGETGGYANVPASIGSLTPLSGADGKYLLSGDVAYDLQDTNDYRAYLMRPMVSALQVLYGIKRYASETLGITLTITNAVRSLVYPLWMTLGNVPTDARSVGYVTLGTLLDDTMAPASFIIGIARLYGLSFIISEDGSITLAKRSEFFSESTPIDITHRVALDKGITLSPVFSDARWFDFALEGVGEYAKKHKEKYDREYGSQRVDTSYEMGESVKNIYEGIPFKISAEVQEAGLQTYRMVFNADTSSTPIVLEKHLPMSFSKIGSTPVSALLYNADGEQTGVTLPQTARWDSEEQASGWLTLNQMCDDDRKAITESGILMTLDATFATTSGQEKRIPIGDREWRTVLIPQRRLYLHSYDATMVALNEGKECWNMTVGEGIVRTTCPKWRNGAAVLPTSIYVNQWENYIEDRYDKDARVMKCSVDFSGMQVGDALLRKFYYYGGAIWVLNKINNYSLTTFDAVECEFIKVKNITNYNG